MSPAPSVQLKNAIRQVVPPLLWAAARRLLRPRPPVVLEPPRPLALPEPSIRVATTDEDLDREIAWSCAAQAISNDEFLRTVGEFRLDPGISTPHDMSPDSPDYRDIQMAVYRFASGRAGYDPATCEMTEFDATQALRQPYPYACGAVTVGEHWMAIGFLLRVSGVRAGDRVLEYGAGWGNTTLALAQMGCRVTVVDINPRFLELIAGRCRQVGVGEAVELVCADMLDYQPSQRFDRVLFFESFHHCRDHVGMVHRLAHQVTPDGAVLFAAEPINDDFPTPWGIRTDGISAFSMRRYGWLELGFRPDYFQGLLTRHGWTVKRYDSTDVHWNRVFVARRNGTSP